MSKSANYGRTGRAETACRTTVRGNIEYNMLLKIETSLSYDASLWATKIAVLRTVLSYVYEVKIL